MCQASSKCGAAVNTTDVPCDHGVYILDGGAGNKHIVSNNKAYWGIINYGKNKSE